MDSHHSPTLAGSAEGSRRLTRSQAATAPIHGTVPPAAGNAPPQQLGPYRLERPIGQGGQATVFLATQVSLQRPVALKVLSAPMAADPHYTERFHAEAKMVARLQHKNVVGVYDSGFDAGFHWLAMELIEGASVRAHLKQSGPIPEHRALEVIREVALAIQCAAEAGILHRDIKPGNVMITADGTAKLADLGLAKDRGVAAQHQTATGVTMGTPFYMSPEAVIGDRAVDVRSDIYSLGIMLFEMLTGRLPLTGETAVMTMMRHAQEDVPPVSSVNSSVTEATELLIRVMVAREREDRYPDAATLVGDLDRVLKAQRPPFALKALRRALEASGERAEESGVGAEASPLPRASQLARRGSSGSGVPLAIAGLVVAIPVAAVAGIVIGSRMVPAERRVVSPTPTGADARRRLAEENEPDRGREAERAADRTPERVAARPTISFGDARRVAEAITEGRTDEAWRDGLATYRTLEIGGDLERLARVLERALDGDEVGLVLWRWATIDRIVADEDDEWSDALDRYRLAIGRIHGVDGSEKLGADIERLAAMGSRFDDLLRRALRSDLRECRAELETARKDFGADVGDEVFAAIKATIELRELVARAIFDEAIDGVPPGWQVVPLGLLHRPSELLRLIRAKLVEVRGHLVHLDGRARRLARVVADRAEADAAELEALGPVRVRGIEGGMAELALRVIPDAGQWSVSENGLRFTGDRRRRGGEDPWETFQSGKVTFELRDAARFRSVTLEVVGLPVLGLVTLDATGVEIVRLVLGDGQARVLDPEAGVAGGIYDVLRGMADEGEEDGDRDGDRDGGRDRRRDRERRASANVGMTIELVDEAGMLSFKIDGRAVPAEAGAWPTRIVFFPTPSTSVREVRLELAPR